MSLQKLVVYMKFPKEVTAVGSNGTFYPNFAFQQQSQACSFFKKIACRVHIIINRQMKCETWNFQSFFNLRVLLLYSKPNLFCPFDHLPTVAAQSIYLICLYSLTWWGCAMSRQQWHMHFFQRRSLFVANQIF